MIMTRNGSLMASVWRGFAGAVMYVVLTFVPAISSTLDWMSWSVMRLMWPLRTLGPISAAAEPRKATPKGRTLLAFPLLERGKRPRVPAAPGEEESWRRASAAARSQRRSGRRRPQPRLSFLPLTLALTLALTRGSRAAGGAAAVAH
uniref:Uncharacterized protein n=1 Tax=Phaeomonas parva TaxID=124430 RepID=A0A7S1XK43_9STRA